MKRGPILFLRVVIVLVGVGVLAGMLVEPQFEGVNANADFAGAYLDDPFLVYAYVGSIPFFFGLYQAFKLLGYLGGGQAFSADARQAARTIKYCALAVIAFIAGAEAYIMLIVVSDDRAGAVMLGILATFVGLVAVAGAAVLERVLQNGGDLQLDHDLTV